MLKLFLGDHFLPLHFVLLEPVALHIIIMHKSSLERVRSTEISSIIMPKVSPLRVKLSSTDRLNTTPHSLNQSTVSLPTSHRQSNSRQPKSFYNDHKNIYQHRSIILSQRSTTFQNKPLTLSQRKRYESDRTQQIVGKRQKLKSQQSFSENRKESKSAALDRFHNIAANKYKKLLYGQQMVKINRVLLEKGIKRDISQKLSRKWSSPFVGQSQTERLRGKPLVSKQLDPLLPPSNPTQIKVLNLDRLFRMKEGRLTNIVPLPTAKLSEVNSREYLFKAVKNQDKIHQAIKQYNDLLKIAQIEKTKPRLGVKGTKFTKSPTIQELMGLKLNPSKSLGNSNPSPLLQPQVFIKHCKHFECVKQDVHIARRIIAGLVENTAGGYLSLTSFTLFWNLFVGRTAKLEEKVHFLTYFLMPSGQERVELEVIRLILEVMCRQLPPIEKLDLRTDILSKQEKSKIFLEALIRVLFGDANIPQGKAISRNFMSELLTNNPDACDLLIRLLQIDQ